MDNGEICETFHTVIVPVPTPHDQTILNPERRILSDLVRFRAEARIAWEPSEETEVTVRSTQQSK